jgi:hypothetical protein
MELKSKPYPFFRREVMKFRILQGAHSQGFYPPGHQLAGKPIEYATNDVVESDSDLARRFNHPGHLGPKFEHVPDDTPVTDKVSKK